MKVLIVDDNKKVRELLRDYLPSAANEIFECGDGEEVLDLYKKYQPDWVLMDWEMPKMNGIDATRVVIAEYPKANICMVTAFDSQELKDETHRAGAKGFVAKDNLYKLEALLTGLG